MTFYSIIYGMLFLGSTSVLFTFVSQNKYEELSLAVILCLLIYSDTIYTTDYVERDGNHVNYKRGMKFIDLICFLTFSLLIIIICPDCIFLVKLNTSSASGLFKFILDNNLVVFYTLLFCYCAMAIRWNELALDLGYFALFKEIFKTNPTGNTGEKKNFFSDIQFFVNKAYYHICWLIFFVYAVLAFIGYYRWELSIFPIIVILFSIIYDLVTPPQILPNK